jgi:hypothetical protein
MIRLAGVKQVVVIGQAPIFKLPAVDILQSEFQRDPQSAEDDLPAKYLLSRQMDEAGMRQASEAAGARYISLIAFLCGNDGCLVRTGPGWQNVVVFDDSHFTAHGSRYVADHVANSAISGVPFDNEVATLGQHISALR